MAASENPSLALTPGLVLLAAANLLPLAGIAFLGWTPASVVVLYFFEAIIVYLVTARMLAVVEREKNLELVRRYLFRYGLGLAIMAVIWTGLMRGSPEGLAQAVADPGVLVSVALFAVGHVISFQRDFIGNKEYEHLPWKVIEGRMGTVFFVLFVVPLMAVEVLMFAPPAVVASVLIIVKTIVSVGAYAKERRRAAAGEGSASTQMSTTPCPHCGKPLRSARAKQCSHCGAAWHAAGKQA